MMHGKKVQFHKKMVYVSFIIYLIHSITHQVGLVQTPIMALQTLPSFMVVSSFSVVWPDCLPGTFTWLSEVVQVFDVHVG